MLAYFLKINVAIALFYAFYYGAQNELYIINRQIKYS